MKDDDLKHLENASAHAWKYFEIHAGQRLSMFNFFTVFAGLISAGLGATLQGGENVAYIGIFLGMVLVLVSFVFWKIDERAAVLVKHAERTQEWIEAHLLPEQARLFVDEGQTREGSAGSLIPVWTFGRSLRVTFAGAAVIGLLATGLSGWRLANAYKPLKASKVGAAEGCREQARQPTAVVAPPLSAQSAGQ
ncbi:hypothetical protein [Novosphingobium naphthalenivorans]|uniref:hypothetical protein n=1 Tax=Novosphingobium naphthalenivorans TaxID=273168 RepID=UPI0008299D77|nr:hypothetical protein [Novosphingobium naphthalenivorans]